MAKKTLRELFKETSKKASKPKSIYTGGELIPNGSPGSYRFAEGGYDFDNMIDNVNEALLRQVRVLEQDLKVSIQKYPGRETHKLSFGLTSGRFSTDLTFTLNRFPCDKFSQEDIGNAMRSLPAYQALHEKCKKLNCAISMEVVHHKELLDVGNSWEPVFTVNVNQPYSKSPLRLRGPKA